MPITRTKILILQRRAELISRQYLLDMLNDLLDYKLIINAEWASLDRQKYSETYLNALQQLAILYPDLKNYSMALDYSLNAINTDNCSEKACQLSMLAYHYMGNLAVVFKTYSLCEQTLLSEIEIKPSPKTILLYKELVAW